MNDLRITNNALGFAAVAGLASVCLQGAAYGEGSEFPDGSVSITSLPFTDTGDTSDNSDEFDAVCPYSGSTSADVFYEMSGDLGEITVTLCDSLYDCKTYILDSAFNVFARNDGLVATTATITAMPTSWPARPTTSPSTDTPVPMVLTP